MDQLTVRVAKKSREAADIVSFEFVSVDGNILPPFSAGAHVDVHIRPDLTRQYSLCNSPSESHRYLIAVLRDPNSRGGSVAIHDEVNEGDVLQISYPRNHFELVPAGRTLLFAGGIGVTPILCMAERLAHIEADFEMHYCSRSPERTAFVARINESRLVNRVKFHFDDGAPIAKLDLPGLLAQQDSDVHLYVCGPKGFIDFVIGTAKSMGWPQERLHLEYFAGAAQDTASNGAFDVQIASSGKVYSVGPTQTVIEVLAEHGIELPVSCEQGVCGTCITRVLDGAPDHRDMYFTDEEKRRNDQFTPCCSRALSKKLVLDL
ncbi:MAG: PDR/VanB family oxidoreductase [Pseudomonadota bacterium]